MPCVQRRRNSSQAWKGICVVWDTVNRGSKWAVGNGNSTRFWLDPWLEGVLILAEAASNQVPPGDIDKKVKDYVGDQGLWKWDLF